MEYFARSENEKGEKETVQHHLIRTAELCHDFAGAFDCAEAGYWMGVLHDFGKYGVPFQEVLARSRCYVDHAMPGAAFLTARTCGKYRERGELWPLVVAVRCHHSELRYDIGPEIREWERGAEKGPDGSTYALTAKTVAEALRIFNMEISLPDHKPKLPSLPERNSCLERNNQKMLQTRMLFSSLTDADYSASAEHFTPDYLGRSAVSKIDPRNTYEILLKYKTELGKRSAADPKIDWLRNKLYEYCERAGKTFETGVYTLTAPTGAGKTLAMLAFALQQMINFGKKRIILVLPYLSIIEQNTAVYRNIIPDILEDHSQTEREDKFARELSQRWDAPFIVTTSVKFFESLFACSGPACRKLHTLADSVVLFDEAQSLPVQLAESTLSALRELSATYRTTVVFSTATQPDFSKLPHMTWNPREIVSEPQAMFTQARRVNVEWIIDHATALEAVVGLMAEELNSCLIVNLRSHAQKAFDALSQKCGTEDTYLMTTDLCPAHRTEILDSIKRKLKAGKPCRLVATQCIEAGVDISFDVMYRALAPLESIIQAGGRCNRSDARKRGRLTVFIPNESKLYPDDFYQQSANAVMVLQARHTIDINDLEHIREYYEILYGSGQVSEKKAVVDAIELMDFPAVAKAYRLIEDDQLQVVVPFSNEEKLFRNLAEEARSHGVTASWMRRAAPLTVHSYRRDLVRNVCERLFVHMGKAGEKMECNWYILSNRKLYDERKGLQLKDEFNGII